MKFHKKDVWAGQYRGVGFEIVNWGERDPNDKYSFHWNYYLFIPLNLVKDKELRKNLVAKRERRKKWGSHYNDTSLPIIHDIHMHGGVTHYDIISGRKSRIVKIGCDYGHLHDNAADETIDSVSRDCRDSIDALKNMDILYNMCQGDGSLTEEKDGYYSPDKDRFYSAKYIDAMPETQKTNWLKNLTPVTPKTVDLA